MKYVRWTGNNQSLNWNCYPKQWKRESIENSLKENISNLLPPKEDNKLLQHCLWWGPLHGKLSIDIRHFARIASFRIPLTKLKICVSAFRKPHAWFGRDIKAKIFTERKVISRMRQTDTVSAPRRPCPLIFFCPSDERDIFLRAPLLIYFI